MEIKLIPPFEAGQFCDNIRLSNFNKIQPYGVLIVLDQNLKVIQHSTNLTNLLNTPSPRLLNRVITNYLKINKTEKDLVSWLKKADKQYKCLYWQSKKKKIAVWVLIHQTPYGILLEIETIVKNETEESEFFSLFQQVASRLESNNQIRDLKQLMQTTCENIQTLTNFDRVIIYQFDKVDHSGLVVGEVRKEYMKSYLGLYFPANDVPQHVRLMYLDIPLRHIPNIYEEPIELIPEINPISQHFINLSHTNLRMVAPVHVQYLSNMQVSAATSIAIIRDKKLWGLIACHHQTPKYLSANLRFLLNLIANTLSSQILALEHSNLFYQQQKMSALQDKITEKFAQESSLVNALEHYHAVLMTMVSAQGMSVYFQKNLLNFGETPESDQVISLITWLQKHHPSKIYATHTLPLQYKEAMNYKDKACGILTIKMTEQEGNYLIFYRSEFVHQVTWAGNPKEALKCSQQAYSPRDSFERFLEIIVNHSSPWSSYEKNSAEFIRSIIINKQLQDLLQLQALHDPLTGLLNRLYMEQSLAIEIQHALREKNTIAILLIDLDHFSKFNNQFGHPAGDFVLKEFSIILKKSFREYDHLYRYGGEEFLLILPRMNAATALERAESFRQELKSRVIRFEGKQLPSTTVSIGLSIYPINGLDTKSLIMSADAALYQAKENGRDCIIVKEPGQ